MPESAYVFPDVKILISEFACSHCGKLPPDMYTNIYYYHFFQKWQRIRTAWGRPVPISKNGGWRCPYLVYTMIIQKRAKAAVSPHSFWALDSDLDGKKETEEYAALVEELYPELRIGYKGYIEARMSFVHLDQAYEIQPRASETWVEGFRF
ncbi:MAG: hypothetical protein V3W19_16325 [Desulfatiglandales bacterium]